MNSTLSSFKRLEWILEANEKNEFCFLPRVDQFFFLLKILRGMRLNIKAENLVTGHYSCIVSEMSTATKSVDFNEMKMKLKLLSSFATLFLLPTVSSIVVLLAAKFFSLGRLFYINFSFSVNTKFPQSCLA